MPENIKRDISFRGSRLGNSCTSEANQSMQKDTQEERYGPKYTTYKVQSLTNSRPAWHIRAWLIIKAFCQGQPKPVFAPKYVLISVMGRPFQKNDIISLSQGESLRIISEVKFIKVRKYSFRKTVTR